MPGKKKYLSVRGFRNGKYIYKKNLGNIKMYVVHNYLNGKQSLFRAW